MTHIPFLFNQTIEQMRCIGARGGKAHARNWQARQRAAAAGPRETGIRDRKPHRNCCTISTCPRIARSAPDTGAPTTQRRSKRPSRRKNLRLRSSGKSTRN
jgi:hypothetical protein